MLPLDERPPLKARVLYHLGRLWRRLGDLAMIVVWPLEWLLHRSLRFFFSVSEAFGSLEGFFFALVWLMMWPFWLLRRAVAGLGRILIPGAVRQHFTSFRSTIDWLVFSITGGLMRLAETFNLDRLVWLVVWLLRPLWWPVAALLGFAYAWIVTRPLRPLLYGLPAILLMLPFVFVAGRAALVGNSGVAAQYRATLEQALEAGDYERVQFCERKLAQLGVDTKLSDFRRAEQMASGGELTAAYARMQQLAPTDEPGYPAAHYWIVQQLLSDNLELDREEANRLIALHLDHLQTLGVRGPNIELFRALLLTRQDRLTEAAERLQPLSPSMPLAAIERLRLLLAAKELDAARRAARTVRTHMQQRYRADEPLTSLDFQWWATAAELLGDQLQLGTVFQRWWEHFPDDPTATKALAALRRQEFRQLVRSPAADPAQAVELFLEAWSLEPDASWAETQIQQLTQAVDNRRLAAAVLEQLSATPKTPSAVLTSIGGHAALDGSLPQAEACFRRALEQNEDNAVAWNNLAWVLMERAGDQADSTSLLSEALAAVNKALAQQPEDYRFRETRGQILVNLGRWDDAITDLEFALNGMPGQAQIHFALASAYEALGDRQLAEAHRQQGK